MKKFVSVIGPRNAGKTTIIRSLTGCRTMGYRGWIYDNSNNHCIFVIAGSPQEADLPMADFVQILDDVVSRQECSGLVMAFQPLTPRRRLPMEDYFTEVHNRQVFEKFAFLLNPTRDNATQNIPDLQRRLNPFQPITIEQLDARRYSFINASIIQALSSIII